MAHPKDIRIGKARVCWSDNGYWVMPGRGTTQNLFTAMNFAEALNDRLKGPGKLPSPISITDDVVYRRRPAKRGSERWMVSVP